MLFEKIKLEDDEIIIETVRRHWFVVLMQSLGYILGALLPLLVYLASFVSFKGVQVPNVFVLYPAESVFFTAWWLLINWMGLAYIWTQYYLDIWVITDRRIIDIDQKRLFSRSIGSFRLERLQDMNVEIPGFLATIFNYGDIQAQTASGSEEEFRVRNLPDPRRIKATILAASDKRIHNMYEGV